MGKQSKRKAVGKKAHEERQEECRSAVNQEDVPTTNNTDADVNGYAENDLDDADADNDRIEEIMVGDRVWWRQPRSLVSWQRGVVYEIIKDEPAHGIHRHLVFNVDVNDFEFCWVVDDQRDPVTGNIFKTIKRDRFDWVPRFSVGDRVVCRLSGQYRCITARVTNLWVSSSGDYLERVAVYAFEPKLDILDRGQYIHQDREVSYLHEYPVTFRFSVGDKVLLSAGKAVFKDGTTPNIQDWKKGKIVKVDYVGMTYECSFLGPGSRLTTCFFTGDDDEHVCRVDELLARG